MAADLRIARRGPAKFGLPEVSLGVLPGTGGTQRLVRIVGKSRAIELMVTGRLFDVDEARSLGVIDEVFDAGSLDEFNARIQDYARQFCPPGKAARAVGRIKRSVQSGAEIPFESALTLERELQQQLFQSEDAKEGLAAYVEKRPPAFKAR
jgi:enoyl-CoA hydratase/carnithine racemase